MASRPTSNEKSGEATPSKEPASKELTPYRETSHPPCQPVSQEPSREQPSNATPTNNSMEDAKTAEANEELLRDTDKTRAATPTPTSASSAPTPSLRKSLIPEDIVNTMATNPRLLAAVVLATATWMISAPQILSISFTAIDCRDPNIDCNFHTVYDDFSLRNGSKEVADSQVLIYKASFMVGSAFAGVPLPSICDRYGRFPLLFLCAAGLALFSTLHLIIDSFAATIAFRIMHGFFYTGCLIDGWLMGYELCPMKYRDYLSFLTGALWVLGACCTALAPLVSLDWRWQTAALGLFPAVYLIASTFLIPETLHFLRARQKTERIKKWYSRMTREPWAYQFDIDAFLHVEEKNTKGTPRIQLFLRFCRSRFCVYILITLYLWFIATFMYYGVTFISTQLAGNLYVNFILINLVEIPGYLATALLLKWCGRRFSVFATYGVTGASFLLITFIPKSEAGWQLAAWLLGKFAVTAALMILFVLTTELFPTNIRGVTTGVCIAVSRVGGLGATGFDKAYAWSPDVTMGCLAGCCFLAALLVLILPETSNRPLPDTFSDLDRKKDKQKA